MAGLSIPTWTGSGGYRPGGENNLGQTGGATIAQTAYGMGSAPVKGGVELWHGFMGIQIAAMVWLVFLRWSLPSGGKRS